MAIDIVAQPLSQSPIGPIYPMRWLSTLSAMLAAAAVVTGIFWLSFGYFQSEEASKSQGQLSLYRSTLIAELQRFSHLTHILARDPFVIETSNGADTAVLDKRLKEFAEVSGIDAIYLMGKDGVTISASNAHSTTSFVGQNYSFRPYFLTAMKGEHGHFYGIGATTGLPGYFLADVVRNRQGTILGVLAIKIDLSKLEQRWRQAGEQVLMVNGDGVVLLASNPAWLYHVLSDLTPEQRNKIQQARQFPGQALEPLDWKAIPPQRARIGRNQRLHLTSDDLPHDWALHYFASDDRAVARSWLVTGFAILIAGLVFLYFQLQRTRRIGAALKRSEEEEALLREANERLAIEIAERRTAEQQLQKTQDELERASRLAALGRLAAMVTHELGQPIAAMRNHIAVAEMAAQAKPTFTDRIGGLVDRMEGITRQLKFFARTDAEDFDNIDLREVMQVSLGLVEPNLEEAQVAITLELPPEQQWVRGNRFRLEQIVTNLLRNAVDACEEVNEPEIDVKMGKTKNTVWFEIWDNGQGLGDATLDDLQEPFVTTRESGRGMGLGLAISAGIVKDHDGQMSAWNRDTGGAVFRVEFPEIVTAIETETNNQASEPT